MPLNVVNAKPRSNSTPRRREACTGGSLRKASRRLWRIAEGRFENIFGKKHAAELRSVLLNIAGNDDLNSLQ